MSVAVSPGLLEMPLTPGEVFEGEFKILNPTRAEETVDYKIRVSPMTFEDDVYTLDFEDKTDYSQIVDWIEVEETSGSLSPHEEKIIKFRISVPEDAPAGGQYASFLVSSETPKLSPDDSSGVSIRSKNQIAILLYSTVAGETRVEGKVLENNVSGFYLGKPITVSSLLSNTGNVHSRATYTLRVLPLFGDEEVYTDEESPTENTVIPGTRLYSEKTWEGTPMLGVYRVEQEIDFGGLITVEEKLSVVCPAWFFVLILAFLASLILAAVERVLRRNQK